MIIMPAANRRDWEELGDELKEGLETVFAEHYVDMLPLLFPDIKEKFGPALEAVHDASQQLRCVLCVTHAAYGCKLAPLFRTHSLDRR